MFDVFFLFFFCFIIRLRTVDRLWSITEDLNILYKENWTRLAAQEVQLFQVMNNNQNLLFIGFIFMLFRWCYRIQSNRPTTESVLIK